MPAIESEIHRARLKLRTAEEADLELLNIPAEPEFKSWAEIAAYTRGELPRRCSCNKGFVTLEVGLEGHIVRLELDDLPRHGVCRDRALFHLGSIAGAVPEKHAHHRMYTMKPWSASPLSIENQQKEIDKVPSFLKDDLHSWMMIGPPGGSKTTYAAAAIYDWLTFRMADVNRGTSSWSTFEDSADRLFDGPLSDRLNFWRVKVPKWVRDTEAWENRDYGDHSVQVPHVTTDRLEEVTRSTELRPILVLEELDKFNPTRNRLRFLYTLIDAVYEYGGCIVSTSNERAGDLQELLGEALYRRLSGKNDPPEEYLFWDMFRAKQRKQNES